MYNVNQAHAPTMERPEKLLTVVMVNPKKIDVKAMTRLTSRPLDSFFHCA